MRTMTQRSLPTSDREAVQGRGPNRVRPLLGPITHARGTVKVRRSGGLRVPRSDRTRLSQRHAIRSAYDAKRLFDTAVERVRIVQIHWAAPAFATLRRTAKVMMTMLLPARVWQIGSRLR